MIRGPALTCQGDRACLWDSAVTAPHSGSAFRCNLQAYYYRGVIGLRVGVMEVATERMNPPRGVPFDDDAGRAGNRRDPGFQAILSETFEKYAAVIYRFAFRRLGNRESAQDVTAQVFLKAARGMDLSFSEEARRAWLFRAARTAIVDHWRSYGECPAVPLEWYAEEPLHAAEADSSAVARVERILARLNPMQRRVLELRFLEGRSLIETAQELGTTEGNVKVLQHRALRRAAELDTGEE